MRHRKARSRIGVGAGPAALVAAGCAPDAMNNIAGDRIQRLPEQIATRATR